MAEAFSILLDPVNQAKKDRAVDVRGVKEGSIELSAYNFIRYSDNINSDKYKELYLTLIEESQPAKIFVDVATKRGNKVKAYKGAINYIVFGNDIDTYRLGTNGVSYHYETSPTYIEFDSNNLNIYKVNDNKVKIQSQYELVPGKYKLKIIYKENKSPKIIDFNVIYLYDAKNEKFNKFNNHWSLSENCDVIEILNEGVKIGGNCEKQLILIQYKKNFDKDLTLKFDFNILNNKTIDMQLTFDERLYINFDNKKIKFQRKEINSNYKESIKTVKEIVYNKFKNNQKYSMIFSKEQNLYILKIIDFFTKEIYYEVNYKDDMSNIKTKHIYDNLRISVGRNNTIMLIESMEIY